MWQKMARFLTSWLPSIPPMPFPEEGAIISHKKRVPSSDHLSVPETPTPYFSREKPKSKSEAGSGLSFRARLVDIHPSVSRPPGPGLLTTGYSKDHHAAFGVAKIQESGWVGMCSSSTCRLVRSKPCLTALGKVTDSPDIPK